MAAETSPPEDPGALGAAADRIRETVKWLITAFAGVGAALIAGSQLASVGKLDGGRLAFAILCVVVGLCALAYAIAVAAGVMTASRISLGDLADTNKTDLDAVRIRVNGDPALLAGFASVTAMDVEYAAALAQRKTDFNAHYGDVHDQGKALTAQLSDAKAVAAGQAVQRLLNVASFYTLSDAFNGARPKMFGGALVAALAIVGFAWAAHPPDEKKQPAVAAPAVVTLKLTEEGRTLLGARVGKKCAKARLRVVVLSTSGGNAEVVTLPAKGCRVARFTVGADLGTIDTGTPTMTAPQPPPTTATSPQTTTTTKAPQPSTTTTPNTAMTN
jgi:hypothetical protein